MTDDFPLLAIDQKSGSWIEHQFSIDGIYHVETPHGPLPLRYINHPAAHELGILILQRADFEAARVAIGGISSSPAFAAASNEETLVEVLLAGAIVCYTRAFGSSGEIELNKQKIFGASRRMSDLHQHVYDLRSKHIAHDVNGFRDVGVGICISPDNSKFDISYQLHKRTPPPEFLSDFLGLLDYALEYCNRQIKQLDAELLDHVEAMGPTMIAELSFLTFKATPMSKIKAGRTGKNQKPFRPAPRSSHPHPAPPGKPSAASTPMSWTSCCRAAVHASGRRDGGHPSRYPAMS